MIEKIKILKEQIDLMINDLKQYSIVDIGINDIIDSLKDLKKEFLSINIKSDVLDIIIRNITFLGKQKIINILQAISDYMTIEDQKEINVKNNIKDDDFEKFFNENKNNEYYLNSYNMYIKDVASAEQKPLDFDQWLYRFFKR